MDATQNGALIPGFRFVKPISMTLTYDDIEIVGIDKQQLVLRYWKALRGKTQPQHVRLLVVTNANLHRIRSSALAFGGCIYRCSGVDGLVADGDDECLAHWQPR